AFLEERGYTSEDGVVVVRREIPAQGKGRAFIGGALAPIADLKALGSLFLDVHGQHQHQTLLDPAKHRDLLDRQTAVEEDLERMREAAKNLNAASERLAAMREGSQRIAQRVDLLKFQVEEIDSAGVRAGERVDLLSDRELQRNAEAILRGCSAAHEALYSGETAALGRIAEAIRAARAVAPFDEGVRESLERAEGAQADLQEFALVLRDYPLRQSFDPARLETIEERLVTIDSLLRKYAPGGSEDGILAYREAAEAELAQLTDGSESVSDLEGRVEVLKKTALEMAATLSGKRMEAAAALEKRVERALGEVGMPRTRFAIDFRTRPAAGSGLWVGGEEVAVDGAGYDVVEFFLSANQGEAMRPLVAIASGGELSRVMLALEVVLKRQAGKRTLVFDEVDAGIGGAVAEAVGRQLRRLARMHQVLCVTHLPQIASQAEHHVAVTKHASRGRTEVTLETLDEAGRVKELARMLAGERVTTTALRHAEEMLQRTELR
ncbi:MAG: DNA repair protein RecN, partial [Acidobacteriota bacterium]